eukprot:1253378-Prorocentrum_lima.AAC.1
MTLAALAEIEGDNARKPAMPYTYEHIKAGFKGYHCRGVQDLDSPACMRQLIRVFSYSNWLCEAQRKAEQASS